MSVARQSVFLSRPALPSLSLPSNVLPVFVAMIDMALLLTAAVVGAIVYQLYVTNEIVKFDRAAAIGLMAGALFVILARPQGLYRFRALVAPAPRLPRVGVVTAVSVLAVICVLFLLKVGSEYSRGEMLVFATSALAFVSTGRLAIGAATRHGIRRGAIRGRTVVTIGDPAEMERLSASDLLQFGIDEVARFALVGGSVDGGLSEKDRHRVAQAIDASRHMRAVEFALILP